MSTVTRSPIESTVTFAALNFKRVLRDWANFFFAIVLPVILYLIFGASQDYGVSLFPNGNSAAFVMIGMAFYGGVTAAVAHAGMTIVEHRSGWGRQLALTPMPAWRSLVSDILILLIRCVLPVVAVFAAGALTGAEMSAGAWFTSFLLTTVCALPFGFYGLIWVLISPNENTVSIAATSILVLAFAGNMFVPLSERALEFARFTPMYGPTALARYPITNGVVLISDEPFFRDDPLWFALFNIGAWTVLMVAAVVLLRRRDKERA